MELYGLRTCDTCRKALKTLDDAVLIDVRDPGLPEPVLRRALAEFGAALVNTRSATWRGLDAAEREKPPAQLLRDHPAVMKRPLVDSGGRLYLGWGPETRAALGVS